MKEGNMSPSFIGLKVQLDSPSVRQIFSAALEVPFSLHISRRPVSTGNSPGSISTKYGISLGKFYYNLLEDFIH